MRATKLRHTPTLPLLYTLHPGLSAVLKALQFFYYLLAMAKRRYTAIDFCYRTLRIDKKRPAQNSLVAKHFLAPRTIRVNHFPFRITQQREIKRMLGFELFMARRVVFAYAYYLRAKRSQAKRWMSERRPGVTARR